MLRLSELGRKTLGADTDSDGLLAFYCLFFLGLSMLKKIGKRNRKRKYATILCIIEVSEMSTVILYADIEYCIRAKMYKNFSL